MPIRIVIHTTLLIALIVLKMLCSAQTAAAGTVDYSYDDMKRLVRTVYDDATVEDYLYDLMGNRLSRHTVLSSSPANTPPNAPSSPIPVNNATGILAFNVGLRWSGGDANAGDAVIYDVYCDTVNPPGLYTRTTETSVDIARLARQQTYYWMVIARDSRGAAVEGPLWQFTTVNTPPNAPAYSTPHINSTVVPDNVYLTWQAATDPDAGDTIVDYDIYFGTSATPPLVAGNQTGLSYPLGTLLPGTVYYWRIVARDNLGGTSTDSPIWSVTTSDHSATVLTDRTFSQDTTLTAADGPYSVTNNATVATGATLTIEPGTILKFENGAGLVVNGNLAAQGTAGQPIIFTSVTDDRYGGDTNGDGNTTFSAPGDWTGIQVTGSTAGLILNMRYCRVFFANNGLTVTRTSGNADVVIDQSEFRNNAADGININAIGGSTVMLALDGTAMTHNGGRGFYSYAEANTLLGGHVNGNTISNNGGYGLYVYGYFKTNIDLVIDGNLIEANQNYGIYLYAWTGYDVRTYFTVSNNRILASGTGIYCYAYRGPMTVTISDNEIANGSDGIYCRSDVDSSS
ncbi:hypothetical protein D1BOALGB6SA_7542, partial [Olavius sp. associated proteobacterium Delta 1]